MFGQFIDRYATDAYGPPVSTPEAIDRAGSVGELVALDVNYPFSDLSITTAQVKAALKRNTAARTLLAIQEMAVNNVGIVLDFGHSLFAKETPADVLQLVHRHGKLISVEVNDNGRAWDDDLAVGSIHIIGTLEFLYALRQIKWNTPILLDQFPFREDTVNAAQSSIRSIRALDRLLDCIDLKALRTAHKNQDALAEIDAAMAECKVQSLAHPLACARDCRSVITVEKHMVYGGLGEACVSVIAQTGTSVRFKIVGIPDEYTVTGSQADIFLHCGISMEGLAQTALKLIS